MSTWSKQILISLLGLPRAAADSVPSQAQLGTAADRHNLSSAPRSTSPLLETNLNTRKSWVENTNMLVAENVMKFDALEPSQATLNFIDADALVALLKANGMAVRGQTIYLAQPDSQLAWQTATSLGPN